LLNIVFRMNRKLQVGIDVDLAPFAHHLEKRWSQDELPAVDQFLFDVFVWTPE